MRSERSNHDPCHREGDLPGALPWLVHHPHSSRTALLAARRFPLSAGTKELVLLGISLSGLGILPFLYVASGFPRFAKYPFQPSLAWAGAVVAAAALWLFYLTHRALGRNWSVSLDLRENHKLITGGIYTLRAPPDVFSFWLWAIAQAPAFPNWIAGLLSPASSALRTLYFFRVSEEEKLMCEAFGSDYRDYMKLKPAALSHA